MPRHSLIAALRRRVGGLTGRATAARGGDIDRAREKWRAGIERQLGTLVKYQRAILDEMRTQQHENARWRWRVRRQLDAVVRQHALTDAPIPMPAANWLDAQRFRLRSQNEEDGITLALLRAGGISTRRFVEIGCGKTGGNSAVLAFEFGWSGLMVDAGGGKVEALARKLGRSSGVACVRW